MKRMQTNSDKGDYPYVDNNLRLFNFKDQEIRMTVIKNEIWMVAADVCKVLEIADHIQAIEDLDEDERGRYIIPTPGGPQKMLCISVPGFYGIVFVSRKPQAKEFKRWLKHEVLPSIYKTGRYIGSGVDLEVDPLEARNNPGLLRRTIEKCEDATLAWKKRTRFYKDIEDYYYPQQQRRRGQRNLPRLTVSQGGNVEMTQLMLPFVLDSNDSV